MIREIAHVCYLVNDLDRATAFYCDVLGCQPAFEFRNDQNERFGVYLKVGQRSFIELFRGTPEAGGPAGSYRHLCLEVDDIDSTVANLRQRGVGVSDPKLGCDQSWQAWLSDPDGNQIELHAYTAASWQTPWLTT